MKLFLVAAAVVLYGNSHLSSVLVSAQGLDTTPSAEQCRVPKPTVSLDGEPRVYRVGANSWHRPVLAYLTKYIGQQFDPPVSFVRETANMYLRFETPQESIDFGYDFLINNPYAASCYETEAGAITLANQVLNNNGNYNLTHYGAVLYVKKERYDIQTMDDIKGKILGTNRIASLATYVLYYNLLYCIIWSLRLITFAHHNISTHFSLPTATCVMTSCCATASTTSKIPDKPFSFAIPTKP